MAVNPESLRVPKDVVNAFLSRLTKLHDELVNVLERPDGYDQALTRWHVTIREFIDTLREGDAQKEVEQPSYMFATVNALVSMLERKMVGLWFNRRASESAHQLRAKGRQLMSGIIEYYLQDI